jgi:hypothetical protein
MSVLRTLSCVLNKDQVDLWSEVCQRDLRTSEQYKSSLPKLRSCILNEISQYKLNKNEQQEVADRIDKLVSPQSDIPESVHDPLITRQPVPGEYELHQPALAEQNIEQVYSLSAKSEEKAVKALHKAWLEGYKLRQILANKVVFVPLSHSLLDKLKQRKLVKHLIKKCKDPKFHLNQKKCKIMSNWLVKHKIVNELQCPNNRNKLNGHK